MALLLLVSFLSFAITLRILIQLYYTGDHGVRFASVNAPLIEIIPGSTFVLSFIVSAVLILLNHFGVLFVPSYFSSSAAKIIGLLGFSGIIITLVGQIQMGRSWRIGVDQNETTELMVSGLYAKSRNPIYFGILLYWLAIALSFHHIAMWVCAVVCWVSIELITRKIEEPYLRRVHRDTFEQYFRGTNRYLIW